MDLLVVRPFGLYKRGDVISDDAAIKSVLASEHATYIVRIAKAASPSTPEKGS